MAYEAQLPCSGSGRHKGRESKPLPQNGCSKDSQSLSMDVNIKQLKSSDDAPLGHPRKLLNCDSTWQAAKGDWSDLCI